MCAACWGLGLEGRSRALVTNTVSHGDQQTLHLQRRRSEVQIRGSTRQSNQKCQAVVVASFSHFSRSGLSPKWRIILSPTHFALSFSHKKYGNNHRCGIEHLLVVVLPLVRNCHPARARSALPCAHFPTPAPRDDPDPHVILVQAHATPGPRGLRPLTKSERRQLDVDQR